MTTPSAPRSRADFLATTAVVRMDLRGIQREFRFPNNQYMLNVVAGIFQGKEYQPPNLPGYVPTTIVDVGANVGATALFFHNAFPAAEIWCYEPCQENFWCLEANTQDLSAQIHVFHYGLLDRDCELPIYHGTSQSGQNSLTQTVETAPISVENVRLVQASKEASQRQWSHISILKIDTEGCEVPILMELLAVVPSIDFIFCEYHDDDDRHTIDSLIQSRFVLGGASASKPHQGMCVYWSRALLERYPSFEAIRKSVAASSNKP